MAEHTNDDRTPAKVGEPTVRLTQCPNCGRKGAAVYPLAQPGKSDATIRLVCPDCCPKPSA
jgi:hypothetical protein